MAGFTDSALEKKLTDLNGSQQSIQTLSLWLIHHRKHHKTIVQVWFKELKKAKPSRKLTFMYLANDVIQNSKKKGPEFSKEFATILNKAFAHVCECVTDSKTRGGLERIISVWEDRSVYDSTVISGLRAAMQLPSAVSTTPSPKEEKKVEKPRRRSIEKKMKIFEEPPVKKTKVENVIASPSADPPDAEDLIKALQDLENSPSTDAVVRQKIAGLPPEVSDISLLDKIQTREAADKLAQQVEEAQAILTDYNARLSEELEERKRISKMLSDFTHAQREQLAFSERKLEEFRDMLKRVAQVRNELRSHLQNLPDLALLPSVMGGLAPLPSAGDLFQ